MNRTNGRKGLADEELQRITEDFTPLVRSLARRYQGRGAEFEDLVQEGYLALIKLAPRCRKKEYMALFLKKRLPAKIRNAAKRLRRKCSLEADITENDNISGEWTRGLTTHAWQLLEGLGNGDFELIKLLAFGYLQREIAEKLGISQQAVSSRILKMRKNAKTLVD